METEQVQWTPGGLVETVSNYESENNEDLLTHNKNFEKEDK